MHLNHFIESDLTTNDTSLHIFRRNDRTKYTVYTELILVNFYIN